MNIFDILLFVLVIAGIYIFLQKRKKKSPAKNGMSDYNALRRAQCSHDLHGVSIVSFYYDSPASYADMEKDGSNVGFDLVCEEKVNEVVKSLKAGGFTPTINALSCVDRVIFYIIY